MVRILSFDLNAKLKRRNPFRSLLELFLGLSVFAKLAVITFLLIIFTTPFIVGNLQIFIPHAQTVTQTIDKQIEASSDDAFHKPTGFPNFSSTEGIVYAGQPGGAGAVYGGWRWTGLQIPQGATINNAYVELNQDEEGFTVPTTLAFENSADPLTFSSSDSPSNRWSNRTTFSSDWTWVKASPGSWIRTPSLAPGVQELVDRYGAINTIVLIEGGENALAGEWHSWESFDASASVSAKLHIEYSTGGAPPSPSPTPSQVSSGGGIIADPNNPSYLVYNQDANSDGKLDPFFMAGPGDPEGFLYRGNRESNGTRTGDQLDLINKLKGTGANSIYLQAVRSHGGDAPSDTSDPQFANPFINGDPSQGVNTAILDQWEGWFTEMDNNGIVPYFFFYDDNINVSSNLGWPLDANGNLHPQEKAFIEAIVNRFKHHKHLIWIVMEEVQEMGGDYSAHAKKIAETIRNADDNKHPIAQHKLPGLAFDEFADDPNIDQFAIQDTNDPSQFHQDMLTAWTNASGRYNINLAEPLVYETSPKTGGALRKDMWPVAMTGANVMVIGMDIANTPLGDLQDLGRIRNFMESTRFNEMTPQDGLKFGNTEYVLAKSGELYIAYTSLTSGSIGLKSMTAGTYEFKWFDTTNGTTVIQSNVSVSAGDQTWTKPAGIGNELAVYIVRTGGGTPSTVFPGTAWAAKTPSELGLDAAKLAAIQSYLGGSGFISRNGYQAYAWGSYTTRKYVASAEKPWYSHFLFEALEDGKIPSLDQKVDVWEPRLDTINATLGFKDKNMTWRQLFNQTAAYGVKESPGTAYNYDDYQEALLYDTLFLKVYGQSYSTIDANVLRPKLGDILQFQDNPTIVDGVSGRPGDVAVSERDFARFGLLYLRKGNWNGTQVINEQNATTAVSSPVPNSIPRTLGEQAEMIPGQRSMGDLTKPNNQTDHQGSYSYLWWVKGVNRNGFAQWPNAPAGTFAALGHQNGKRGMAVVPSLDIVISWNDTTLDTRPSFDEADGNPSHPLNEVFKLLNEAVTTSSSPTPTPTPSPSPVAGAVPPSRTPPGGLAASQVPQFITIGSDDNNVSAGVDWLVNEVFGPRTNPAGSGNPATYDGVPAKGTFYVIGIHETFGGGLCTADRNAYIAGHEVGNHAYENIGGLTLSGWQDSISKTDGFLTRGPNCSVTPKGLGIPKSDIFGFRAPQDAYNDDMYTALGELNYKYAASTAVGHMSLGSGGFQEDGTNLPWPGTLENGYVDSAGKFLMAPWQKAPPIKPGFWEVPQTIMTRPDGTRASAACDQQWFGDFSGDPNRNQKVLDMLKHSLDLHLQGNRSPLHLCIHSQDWVTSSTDPAVIASFEDKQRVLEQFLDYALTKPEVRVVRQQDMINWMKNPVALGPSTLTPTLSPALSPTPTPTPTISVTGTIAISNVVASSGKTYQVDTVANGKNIYIDRTLQFSSVPFQYAGLSYIRTANDDKAGSTNPFLTFAIDKNASVYVAYDDRITTKPSWLTSSFVDTGDNISVGTVSHSVFTKEFPAGLVSLGPNAGGTNDMYFVIAGETLSSLPLRNISGTIWYDDDNDGIVDATEALYDGTVSGASDITISGTNYSISATGIYQTLDTFTNGVYPVLLNNIPSGCTTTNPRDATVLNVNATVNFPLLCGVATATPTPLPQASSGTWPAKIDLQVGESAIYTLADATTRNIKLVSYNIVAPRHKILATVEVSGAGQTKTHTLGVAYDAAAVAINGVRIYGYAWKEADDIGPDNGFEQVGITGQFPLTSGKDVGFAVSDAKFTMYPDMQKYTYPFDNLALYEGADGLATFLEPAGDQLTDETQAYAHAGVDVPVAENTNLIAMTDGVVWYQLDPADRSETGQLWISASNGQQWTDPVTWLWTHVGGGTAKVANGTRVTKGQPLAQRVVPGNSFHMGSKNSFDFGSWPFLTQLWNYQHANDFPVPQQWLFLGPYQDSITGTHIASDETQNISNTLLPRENAKDKDNVQTWKYRDNLVNSVLHLGELASVYPFSGNVADHNPPNVLAYLATYIYSPTSRQATLKWGSGNISKAWLNGQKVLDQSSTTYVRDATTVPMTLQAGWNTFIVKTYSGSNPWRISPKIGDGSGNKIPGVEFSTRDINLQKTADTGSSVSLSWSDPNYHGTFVDTYKLDVSTDPSFTNPLINNQDLGKVTSYTVSGLNSALEYYIRVRPYNNSEFGGSTYWQHTDMIYTSDIIPTLPPPIPYSISGTIWYDDDNDGIVDAAEALYDGTVSGASDITISGTNYSINSTGIYQTLDTFTTGVYPVLLNNIPTGCTTTNPRDATIFNVNATVNFPLFCGVVSPTPTPISTTPIAVSNVVASSGQTYQVDTLANSKNIYIDRTFQFSGIPLQYSGLSYIRTANGDKEGTTDPFLTFSINKQASIYVAYDDRLTTKPAWLTSFTDTGDEISVQGLPHSVLTKEFAQGQVSLGPNQGVQNSNMYFVLAGETQSSIPLSLLSTTSSGLNSAVLTFNKSLDTASAQNVANYRISSSSDSQYATPRAPITAVLDLTAKKVTLSVSSAFVDGASYIVTVNNVKDSAGATITPNTQGSFTFSTAKTTIAVDAGVSIYPFKDTIRGVATNNWNWLYHGLWDRPGSCCPPGKTNAITEATKILRPGIIRFAGGLWANNVGWDRTGSSPEEGSWTFTDSATGQTYSYGHKYTPQMVDAFADFATKVGAKAIVQMNVCDNNPKMWADLLRYTNIEKRYGFEYWELGNEQTLDPCGLDAASYAARYASYRVALKAVDPTIKMLGPVAHMPSYPDWEDTLVGTVGNAVDVLTWHWYQLTEWTSDTGSFAYQGGSIEALFAHDGNVGSVCQEGFGCTSSDPQGGNIAPDRLGRWTYRRGIAEAKLRQVNQYRVANPTMETAITEFGPHAVLHEHPINSNHAAAIWLADILARHAYNKTDIITFYSLEDGSNGPSTTNSRGLLGTWPDTSLDVRPIYNTMLMYSKYFGDMLVKSSTSDPEQNIVGWASTDSKDPGTLKLMLVNFTDQPSATNISLSNFAARSGSAYEMTSDNPLSVADPGSFTNHSTKINGVLIPDVSIADPQAFLQVANNLPSKSVSGITQSGSNSSFSYTIPAYSAVSVVLNQDAAPSCQLTSASWNKSTAIEGEAVTLNVTGSSSCNGKQVNFEVRENDSLLEGLVDEPVSINPQPATFNGATATTTWVSEWQNDCNGGCLPPEYYFNVSLTDNSAVTIRSSDPLLEVEKNVIPTPTPTPSPTLAPTSTPIPPILSPTPTRTPTSTLTPTPTSIPIIPHRISGTIWYDDDNDGIVDAAEALYDGTVSGASDITISGTNYSINSTGIYQTLDTFTTGVYPVLLNNIPTGCTTTNPRDATIFNVNATVNFPLFCGVVSPTPTLAPTATIFPTSSPTPAPTITPTVIPTRTPTPSATPVPSPSIILTPTPTEAVSPTLAVATSTPTPTSVPTPTPVPCALVSASWVTSSNPVGEGEEVTLNAVTNNSPSCIGKQVAFEVRENNSFVEGLFDRSAKAQPESSIISDNRSNTTWTAEYIEDGFFGLFDPPEYFFKAVVVGEGTPETRSTDPLLQVNRAEGLIIVGNPAATNITENSATIEWETNTESTSKVLYGLRSEHRGTTIEDTSLRTTLHSVPIPNLESCALYRYLVSSREREFGTIANRDGTFATLGCNGSVIDSETTDTLVDDLEGRDIDTIDDNEEFPDGLALSIPPSFLSSDAYFQILRLDHNDFVSRIASIPAGLTVANHVYHLNSFLEDEDTEVDNFVSDLTLSIKYKPTDIANIDEDTLTIYKLAKDGAWRELTGCLLDKQERTVTCTTSSFSDFVLLGEPLPPTPTPSSTPEPTQQPGGYNSPYNSPSDGAYGTPSDGGYGTPSYGTPSSGKQGDLNNDGKVNIFDVSIMLRNWNKSGTGDLNSDGKVNIFDASILLRNWSK